jgi:hypothetical protein
MYKIIILIGLLALSKSIYSQNIVKKQKNKSKIDSCLIFSNLIKKHWKYQSNGNYYQDSLDIVSFYSDKYYGFKNCLNRKTKSEIIKLLGAPSFKDTCLFKLIYYMAPNGRNFCCTRGLSIHFDKNWRVKLVDIIECNENPGYRKLPLNNALK